MRDLTDPMDRFWTIDQAAEHFGVTRRTIERYVQDGLPVHFPEQGGYLDRDELLPMYRAKAKGDKATRFQKRSA